MASRSRVRADALRSQRNELEARVSVLPAPPPLVLSPTGFDVFAEVKMVSPAEGRFDMDGPVESRVMAYDLAGAAAISVLTEPSRFDGSLSHLEMATVVSRAPVMRKDFLVDPIQVLEARSAGAGGVLLIAAIVEEAVLDVMAQLALSLGMFVLVEVFGEDDLRRARSVFDLDVMVGVNSRDLRSLEVDFDRFEAMRPVIPGHLRSIAESGVSDAGSAAAVASLGYDAVLCGSALMREHDPSRLLAELLTAGRGVRSGASV